MADLRRRRDVGDGESGSLEQRRQPRADVDVAPCVSKNAPSAFRKSSTQSAPAHAQRPAAVVFDREAAAWLERGRELLQMRLGVWQKKKDPARED